MKKFLLLTIFLSTICVRSQTTIKMEKEGGVYTIPCTVNGIKLKLASNL